MNRRLALTLVCLAGALTLVPPAPAQLERPPVPVQLILLNDTTNTVELLGRNKEWVTFRRPGAQIETELKPPMIKWVDFGINLDTNGVNELYRKGEFGAAAAKLDKLVTPLFIYLDLASDLPAQTVLLVNALYRAGKYNDAITLCNVIINTLPDEDKQNEARVFKVLSLIGSKDRWQANLLLKSIGKIHPTNQVAAIYYYATAQVHLAYTNWFGAQEFFSKVVAFCPRNEEWVAPSLFLSADCYARDKQYAVAEQILNEFAVFYPNSIWPEKARPLIAEYKRKRLIQEALNKRKDELPEERSKKVIKNLLKEKPEKGNNNEQTTP